MDRTFRVIAIDGPASSGKGTVAAYLAKELQYIHVDSGLFYRYFAHVCSQTDDNASVENTLRKAQQNVVEFFKHVLQSFYNKQEGVQIITALKTETCGQMASTLSANGDVRQCVNAAIRSIDQNIVIDGRDTTTVIFPNADVKLFITADIQARAKRRMLEAKGRGEWTSNANVANQEFAEFDDNVFRRYIDAINQRDCN
ncbi:MAG: (d)CMP kinase, partial [Holosporales bacterium]|nr:(d)CMP kinase [Holosporales bacterium]